MSVLHTAIWVNDLETTAAFYADLFGLEHTRDFVGVQGETNYYMKGTSDAEIQFKHGDPVEVDPGTFDHIAIAVDDVDATIARATESGTAT